MQPKKLRIWFFGSVFFGLVFFFCALYGMVVAKYLFVERVTLMELMKIGCW